MINCTGPPGETARTRRKVMVEERVNEGEEAYDLVNETL